MASSPRPAGNQPSAPTISHPAHTLLSRSHSSDTASRIFTDKIKNKPLLLEPTVGSDKRALRRHIRLRKKEYYLRRRKPRPLSAKEKRALGVFELKKDEVKYEVYTGLHGLWNGYMLEILGFTKDGAATPKSNNPTITAQGHGGVLASADFHGAEVEVVRCTDAGKVGIKGIVVRDTKFTFVVVTCKNELKTLPKRDTVFRYEVALPGENAKKLVFEVHGNQFEFRPADRASRKFKWKAMDYL